MAEFKGNAYAISQVVKGLHVVDLHPTKIYCNCCAENVESIEFLNASFVPERTCKLAKVHDWDDEWEPFGYECESCGEGLPRCYGSDKFGMVTTPNYCPSCGAKVVD